MFGRIRMINRLLSDGIIDTTKPHHLLGCSLPQEFKAYRDLRWIHTIDTSNPVLKNAVNRKAEHLSVEKKFESTSHRFNMNSTGVSEYWAEKGFKDEMFSLTRGTSQLTDSKWATTLVQMHLKETVAWNDPSRFS